MTPHIILVMQTTGFEPIVFVEELCHCDDDGYVVVFPDFDSAVRAQNDEAIDGRIVKLPVY